jgi:hypothetical protein
VRGWRGGSEVEGTGNRKMREEATSKLSKRQENLNHNSDDGTGNRMDSSQQYRNW